jgi:integrase
VARRIGIPAGAWPAEDQALWERAFARGSIFDDRPASSDWRPATRRQAYYAYGRWLGYLSTADPKALREPAVARVTEERARAYFEARAVRLSAMGLAAELQHLLLALRAIAPNVDWSWLRDWQTSVQRRARPHDKRAKLVDPLRLWQLGLALMDSASQVPKTLEAARQYRDGLIIALLVARPLRRGSFAALAIGTQLLKSASGYVVELRGEDTKNGQPIDFEVPSALTPYMDRYLADVRYRFRGHGLTDALWLSTKGGRLVDEAIHAIVCRRTKAAFGIAIHPHLFRDIAATALARAHPHAPGLARDLLAHTNVETTQNFYTQAKTSEASRRYNEITESRRRSSRQ